MTRSRSRKQHGKLSVEPVNTEANAALHFQLPAWLPSIAIWLAVAVAVFVLTYRPITDPDTWFHLELGEWIAATNQLPHTDPFSYTAGDTPYVPSGWLTAWLMFQLDKVYPESSLGYILMVTFVIALASLVVMWRARRCGTTVATGLMLMAGLTAAVVRFSPRPDIWSILGLTISLALMSTPWTRRAGNEKGTEDPPDWRQLWLLVPLVILWANLHAGVLVALPFLGIYLGWLLLRWWQSRAREWLLAAIPVAVAGIAWLLNPYGWGIVGLALRIARMPDVTWVMEWMPFFKSNFPLAAPVYICTALLMIALAWAFARNRRAFHGVEILWLVMLVALTLLQRRQISLAAFGIPLLLARHILPLEYWLRGRGILLATALPVIAAILTVWVQVSGANDNGGGKPGFGRNCTTFPCYTADFLRQNPPPEPIFNSYNFGGYLLHALYPETRVYIDGRLDVYPEQVWLDMLAVEENRLSIDELVARYGIQTFVVGVADSFGDPMHIASRLSASDDYVLVHLDDVAAVFVRRTAENMAWVERFGYETLSPWNLDEMAATLRQAEQIERVTHEMGRLLEQSPASAATHALAAYIAWLVGDQITMNEQLAAARQVRPDYPLLRQVQRRMLARGRRS